MRRGKKPKKRSKEGLCDKTHKPFLFLKLLFFRYPATSTLSIRTAKGPV